MTQGQEGDLVEGEEEKGEERIVFQTVGGKEGEWT